MPVLLHEVAGLANLTKGMPPGRAKLADDHRCSYVVGLLFEGRWLGFRDEHPVFWDTGSIEGRVNGVRDRRP